MNSAYVKQVRGDLWYDGYWINTVYAVQIVWSASLDAKSAFKTQESLDFRAKARQILKSFSGVVKCKRWKEKREFEK